MSELGLLTYLLKLDLAEIYEKNLDQDVPLFFTGRKDVGNMKFRRILNKIFN